MILYDHILRITADAPNRLADLRKGVDPVQGMSMGSFGAVQECTLLFMRSGCDAAVSNVVYYPREHPPASYPHTGSFVVTAAYCHLDFDPIVSDVITAHDIAGEFVSRLGDTMCWDLGWGWDDGEVAHTEPIFPYFSSNLDPWAQFPERFRVNVDVGRFAGLRVECRIPDAELIDALNAGKYKGVRFGTRVIRLALRCEAV